MNISHVNYHFTVCEPEDNFSSGKFKYQLFDVYLEKNQQLIAAFIDVTVVIFLPSIRFSSNNNISNKRSHTYKSFN